ncbi:MAG: hypothetical protein ACREE2_21710 [Stellaceae bacterium]
MSKSRALALCCCFAALPLVGCAGGPPGSWRPAQANAPAVAAADAGPVAPRVYGVASGAPAAILVMLPGPDTGLAADPGLWAAQGFDVVTPSPVALSRLVADRETAIDGLIARAEALADAPVWLIGPNPAITAAMSALPLQSVSEVAGIVMTSAASGAQTCSETMTYTDPGNGSVAQVKVSKSGNACPAGSPFGIETSGGVVPMSPAPMLPAPMPPALQSRAPKVIEASVSAGDSPAARHAAIMRVAQLIKATPAS